MVNSKKGESGAEEDSTPPAMSGSSENIKNRAEKTKNVMVGKITVPTRIISTDFFFIQYNRLIGPNAFP